MQLSTRPGVGGLVPDPFTVLRNHGSEIQALCLCLEEGVILAGCGVTSSGAGTLSNNPGPPLACRMPGTWTLIAETWSSP